MARVTTAVRFLIDQARLLYVAATNREPRKTILYFDTARHFRSKALCYYLMVIDVTCEVRFFAEGHGKTMLDGSFAKAKNWLREDFNYAVVKRGERAMLEELRRIYVVDDYQALPLPLPKRPWYGLRRLQITGVASIHDMWLQEARGAGDPSIVINERYGKRTEMLLRWEKLPPKEAAEDGEEQKSDWATKQELETYVSRIRKKFARFF